MGQRRWVGGLALALLGVSVALLLGQQVPVQLSQNLGALGRLIDITGLRTEPEQSPEGAFRWSGRRVTFDLQPLGYPLTARVRLKGERPAGQPPAILGASAGSESLGVETLPRTTVDREYRLPAAAMFTVHPQLALTTTVFRPPGDPRDLGLVFFQLDTLSGPGPSVPAPWPAAMLLLSGVLVFALGGRAVRQVRAALVLALGWGLALGVLNALARPWLVYNCVYFAAGPVALLLLLPWLQALRSSRARPAPPPIAAPDISTHPGRPARAVIVAALLVLVWHLIAPVIPDGHRPTDNLTWGVAFYGALPWPLQALGVLLALAAIPLSDFGLRILEARQGVDLSSSPSRQPGGESGSLSLPDEEATSSLVASVSSGSKSQNSLSKIDLPIGIVAILGVVLGLLFPVHYAEGDSPEFDQKIIPGELWRERELLDFYLKARLWRLVAAWVPRPSQVYAVVAAVAGGVYLIGALVLGRTLGRTRAEAWLVVAGLAALGNAVLFFGYVESYAIVQVLSLFVIWACWRYTEGRIPFGTVAALATVAVFFHGLAVAWGPMVVAAWLGRTGQLPQAARWRTALREGWQGGAVALAIVMVVLSLAIIDGYGFGNAAGRAAGLGGGDGHTLIPLFQTETANEYYPWFSWAALGAFAQEQLLTAPLALLTIGLVSVTAGPGVRRLVRAVPAFRTLLVGAAGMFLFSITWNPDAGPRQDWDLLSISAIPLTLVAVYLLLHLPPGRARRLAFAAYLSVSAVHAAGWVLLHVLGIHF